MTSQQASVKADLDRLVSNLLALDQSSTTTGYSIFKDGNPVVVSHFTAKGTDLGSRLEQLRNKIIELINEYEIDEVVFEDIQLQNDNIKTYKILAEVIGVLEETLIEMHIPYEIIPPIVWKAGVKIAGKGRAEEKKLAQKYVLNNYNYSVTEDEADAICIGKYFTTKFIDKRTIVWGEDIL